MAQPKGRYVTPGKVDPSVYPKQNFWCVSCNGKHLPSTWTLEQFPDETYQSLGYNKQEGAHFYFHFLKDGEKLRYFQVKKVPMCLYKCYKKWIEEQEEESLLSSLSEESED